MPDLTLGGGVSNYYKTLKLDSNNNIYYFIINSKKSESAFKTGFSLFYKYCAFISLLIKNRYSVVISNPSLEGKGKSFYREMIFIFISNLLNRKTIVFFRGWAEPFEEKIKKSKFISFLFKLSYAKAKGYIVLGNIFKNKLINLGVPKETKFFIETTVADSKYINDINLNNKILSYEDEIKFLFLSRVEKIKGIYIAIDAFNEFKNKFPGKKCSLIIAGEGPDLNAVKKYVEQKSICNIEFAGYVSGELKRKILLESHVMLFPSYTEGMPNTILEGMLYAMPIISRSVGGIPEIINQNTNGFITESYSSSAFTEFLEKIAFDKALYKNIATTNHDIATKKFTSEKVKERILNILSEV